MTPPIFLMAYLSQTSDLTEQRQAEKMMIENNLALERYDRVIDALERLI